MIRFIFFFLFIFIPYSAYPQEDERTQMPVIPKKDSTYVGEKEIGKKKNIRITPFLAPSVTPETDLMFNLGGLISFHIDPDNPKVQRSSVPFSIGYSTNNSLLFNLRPAIFFKRDMNRISGDLWIKDMPDNYWGVGYDNANNIEKGDSTHYHRTWWQIFLKYTHHLGKRIYGGVLLDVNQTIADDLNEKMANDPNVLKDGTSISNGSLGLLLQYDTRDVTVNAYDGVFLELSSNFYGRYLGGDQNYQVIILDYRQYQTIKRPGMTLSWQVKSRIGTGDVPWPEMSQLGTPFDLRGYTWGRYRDRSMLLGIAEYRHMFMRKKPRKDGNMMSRFGFVSWLATGSIGNSIGELTNWLPNGGVGLRFEVQKRMNARVDFGVGQDSRAFYVSFNEAF